MTQKIIKLTQTATNAQLLDWHNQYSMYQKDIKFLMNKDDVAAMRRFYSDNGIRIESVLEKLNELSKKYYEFQGDVPKVNIINNKPYSILKEGMSEEEYQNERNELLFTEVPVNI